MFMSGKCQKLFCVEFPASNVMQRRRWEKWAKINEKRKHHKYQNVPINDEIVVEASYLKQPTL